VNSVVVLDSGPLGLGSNPRTSAAVAAFRHWLQGCVRAGARVIIPEIADYEVRRELLRAKKTKGLRQLDLLTQSLEFLPINSMAMRRAAEYWAQARQTGMPTAADPALDGDMILAAQASTLGDPNVVVATTNVGHLSRFVVTRLWQSIEIR
jgi:predicted nucleic acid-binding protein